MKIIHVSSLIISFYNMFFFICIRKWVQGSINQGLQTVDCKPNPDLHLYCLVLLEHSTPIIYLLCVAAFVL